MLGLFIIARKQSSKFAISALKSLLRVEACTYCRRPDGQQVRPNFCNFARILSSTYVVKCVPKTVCTSNSILESLLNIVIATERKEYGISIPKYVEMKNIDMSECMTWHLC